MDRDSIREEIKGLGPHLSAIEKTNCYKVPVAYFEQLKLKEGLSRKDNYRIPEHYFSKMQAEVLGHLSTDDTKKEVSIFRKILPWSVGIAASLLLVISLDLGSDKPLVHNDPQEDYGDQILYLSAHLEDFEIEDLLDLELTNTGALDHVETDLIEDYIQNNLEEFDLNDLEDLL